MAQHIVHWQISIQCAIEVVVLSFFVFWGFGYPNKVGPCHILCLLCTYLQFLLPHSRYVCIFSVTFFFIAPMVFFSSPCGFGLPKGLKKKIQQKTFVRT